MHRLSLLFFFQLVQLSFCHVAIAQLPGELVSQRLSDVVAACDCAVTGLADDLLKRELASSQWLADDEGMVIAFRGNGEEAPLEVMVAPTPQGPWQQASFAVDAPGHSPDARGMGGSVWNIERMHGYLMVGMRIAPDGIATSIFTAQLARLGQTYGRIFGLLPGPIAIYQRPLPRFGPTHYTELTALDVRSGAERDIYPQRPYAEVRQQAMALAKVHYDALGRDGCARNNHHCDPVRFDNFFGWRGGTGEFFFDAQSGNFVVAVTFMPTQDLQMPVVVLCSDTTQLDSIHCDESPLAWWQDKLQTTDLQEILPGAAQ